MTMLMKKGEKIIYLVCSSTRQNKIHRGKIRAGISPKRGWLFELHSNPGQYNGGSCMSESHVCLCVSL